MINDGFFRANSLLACSEELIIHKGIDIIMKKRKFSISDSFVLFFPMQRIFCSKLTENNGIYNHKIRLTSHNDIITLIMLCILVENHIGIKFIIGVLFVLLSYLRRLFHLLHDVLPFQWKSLRTTKW